MKNSTVEFIAAGVFAAFFGYLFFEAIGYRGRSAYMPMAASGVGLLMCLFWSIGQLRQRNTGSGAFVQATKKDARLFAFIVGTMVIYVLAFAWVGFFTSTLIMVPALSAALGYRNWKVMCITAVGFCVVIFAVFRLLLSIPLPQELILKLLGD